MKASASRNPAPVTPGERGLSDLSFLVNRLVGHYTAQLTRLLKLHGLDDHLGPGMGPVLFALFDRDAARLSELAAATDLAPSSITELVKRMEKRGLLHRAPDPDDGRAVRIRLTPLGRSLRTRCRALSRDLNGSMETPFTAAELATLRTLWERLIRHLGTDPAQR